MNYREKRQKFTTDIFNLLNPVKSGKHISPMPSRMVPRKTEYPDYYREHKTICFSCNMTCEVLVYENTLTGKIERIEGDPFSPVTGGALCSKGLAATDLVYNPGRIKTPLKRTGPRGSGQWESISWEAAIEEITDRLENVKRKSGAHTIAFLEGTRRGWSRVYTRFAYAYGIANHGAAGWAQCLWPRLVDTSATFGAPYSETPDLKHSQAILVWGANPANTWPVFAKEIMEARGNGAKLITVDPYLSETASKSDIWVQLKPGTDTALALTMINFIINGNLYDSEFVRDWTVGFEELKNSVRKYTLSWGEEITGVPSRIIKKSAELYAKTKPASIYRCVSIDQQHDSVQTCRAISILIAITGNTGIKGGNVVPSDKGDISQNTLKFIGYDWLDKEQEKLRIGYEDYPLLTHEICPVPSAHMPSLWNTILTGKPYPIKTALIFGSNAAISYSNTKAIKEAINQLDFLAVADLFMTDTARLADIVLPASSWLERDNTVSSFQSSRTCLLCQQKVTSVGESKSDLEIIFMMAEKLGIADKFWQTPGEMYDYLLKPAGYTLAELKKERRIEKPVSYKSFLSKGFSTPSGKVELASSVLAGYNFPSVPEYTPPGTEEDQESSEYPLVLTTGARVPFFRHTENRNNPTLLSLFNSPTVILNSHDAEKLGIKNGSMVKIITETGESLQKAKLSLGLLAGTVLVIPGWGGKGNINLAVPWKNFSQGIGSVPMRYIRCRIEPADEKE